MPVTPFHFGPGILLKACAPRAVSLTAFVVPQVVIDIESGYHLLWGGWPLHRGMHSLPLAGLVGILAGLAVWLVGRRFRSSPNRMIRSEVSFWPTLSGGLFGGLSHPLIDAVMHADLQPFWPVSEANPLLAVVGLGHLHAICVGMGVAGVAVLAIRVRMAGGRLE